MLYNKANVKAVKCAAKEDARPEIHGVFFTKDKTVATDSYCLVEVSVPQGGEQVDDYPELDGKVMRSVKPFIVSADDMKRIKLNVNKSLPILSNMAIRHVDKDEVKFLVPASDVRCDTVSARRVEGTFPEYEKIFDEAESKRKTRVLVNVDYLKAVLDVVGEANKYNGGENKVFVEVGGEHDPIVIRGINEKQPARAAVMPIMQG